LGFISPAWSSTVSTPVIVRPCLSKPFSGGYTNS